MKALILAVLLVVTSGCATGYGPKGWKGGYYDNPMGKDKFLVGYEGNGYTAASTATQYAHKRAQELCVEKGFSGYDVVDTRSTASVNTTPDNFQCSQQGFGMYATTNCKNTGGQTVSRPNTEIIIKCE